MFLNMFTTPNTSGWTQTETKHEIKDKTHKPTQVSLVFLSAGDAVKRTVSFFYPVFSSSDVGVIVVLLGVVFLSLSVSISLPQSVISLRAHPLSIPKDSIFIIILSRHVLFLYTHTSSPRPLSVHSFLNKKRSIAWCMILSFSLFPFFFFPLSLFSLFSVQHPGIKILRSDSSSSISSRIGWISPLSLTLSLSCLCFLRLVWFWLFFLCSPGLPPFFFSLLLHSFFVALIFIVLPFLFFFLGLVVWPYCCALLTVITWLTLCLPTVPPLLLLLAPALKSWSVPFFQHLSGVSDTRPDPKSSAVCVFVCV